MFGDQVTDGVSLNVDAARHRNRVGHGSRSGVTPSTHALQQALGDLSLGPCAESEVTIEVIAIRVIA